MPTWIVEWLRDSRLLIIAEIAVVAMSTLLAILLARNLGPSSWGLFSALLGLALALAIFVEAGLGTWLLRELSHLHGAEPDPESRRLESAPRLMGGVLATGAIGALSLLTLTVVAVFIGVSPGTTAALLGLVGYVIALSASSCLGSFLRAERKLKKLIGGMLLERSVLLVAVALALLMSDALWLIAFLYLGAGAVRLAYLGVVVFWSERVPIVVPPVEHVRNFVLRGAPFAFNTVALVAIPKLDTLIVSLVSTTSAGYFALGDRIMSPAMFIPVVASTALYPYLAREPSGSRATWKISGGMLLLGGTAAVIGVVLAPWAVPLIFGESYRDAVAVVQVMLLALPFIYASNSIIVYLYTTGRERRTLAATFGVSVLGTACLVLGLVAFGATGAAVGFVLRQVMFTATLGALAAWSGSMPVAVRQ